MNHREKLNRHYKDYTDFTVLFASVACDPYDRSIYVVRVNDRLEFVRVITILPDLVQLTVDRVIAISDLSMECSWDWLIVNEPNV